MITVALAAGYATRLYPLTENFPKPLLEVAGSSILDRLLADFDSFPEVTRHVVISNHRYIGRFEEWLRGANYAKPIELLDDGTTDNDHRLGAVCDIQFAIERLSLDDDLLVYAGDNLLDFSLRGFADSFHRHNATSILCYHEPDEQALRKTGVLSLGEDFRVLEMLEKPKNPPSHWAVPPFYIYARRDLPQVKRAIELGAHTDSPGGFIAYLAGVSPVYAWPMPGKRYDVGTLENYEQVCELFAQRRGGLRSPARNGGRHP